MHTISKHSKFMATLGMAALLALGLVSCKSSSSSGSSSSDPTTETATPFAMTHFIKAINADANDQFGHAVAMSGDTMVVSTRYEASNQTTITNGATASADNTASTGAVYVYVKASDGSWAQQAYLKASNADVGDMFGISLAISGDTIAVGATREASNQVTVTNGTTASADNTVSLSGAAYIFQRTGTTWVQQAYLKASNADGNDRYGISIAIDGDTVVVGSYQESSATQAIINGAAGSADNSSGSAGAAYVYKRTGSTWVEEAYLKADNAGLNDMFGDSVGVSGDTIVVGASWEKSNQNGITSLGSADDTVSNSGAVYVFQRTGSTWASQAYLKASNAGVDDLFGLKLAISGDTIVVGAATEDSNQRSITNGATASTDNTASNSGAAYVFKRTGSTWVEEAYLKSDWDTTTYGATPNFGNSVAIDGDSIVVGAYFEGIAAAQQSGAAYLFKRTGSTWAQEEKLIPTANRDVDDEFGGSVGVSGGIIAVGSLANGSNQTSITTSTSANNAASNAGAAYIFN